MQRLKRAGRFLHEPLVQFMLLGAMLFALQAALGTPEDAEDSEIEISAGQIEHLRATWARKRGRAPSNAELRELVDGHLREEVYYREAVRMGLAEDDVIVRRRLAHKLEFLINNRTIPDQPPEPELEAFFAEHAERYREPAKASFTHVYFSSSRRPQAAAEAEALLAELRATASPPEHAAGRGDPFMHHSTHAERSPRDVAKHFGDDFARDLFELEPGGWQGPLHSAYGVHLVRLTDKRPVRDVELAEARDAVVRDWRTVRRGEANANAYARLRERYEVSVAELPSGGDEAQMVIAAR